MENRLDRNNIENFMSLTSLQQGILFHYISDMQNTEYHEQLSITIMGDIKVNLMQKAWDFVIKTNEMLRTVFRWKGINNPVQVVLKEHKVSIEYSDITDKTDQLSEIEAIKIKDLSNKIDITCETLRIYLCKLSDYKYEMILSNHHILYDGWSNGIIIKELISAYTALYAGGELKKKYKTKFNEFIKYTNGLEKEKQKDYWVKYLSNLQGMDDYFSNKEKGDYKEVIHKLDNTKANIIRNFARENRFSLAAMLYSIYGILIQKLSNSKEIIFGTTVSGRPENIKFIDEMVGLFINTIPLRISSEDTESFIKLINEINMILNQRKDFENTPLIQIKEYLGLRANEELFNSIVTIENYPWDLSLKNGSVLSIDNFNVLEKTNYNMVLEILVFDEIEFKFSFNSLAIDEHIAMKLGTFIEKIIDVLIANPQTKISEIELLPDVERNQIIYEFNNTATDYPRDKTVQKLFEEQAEKTPNKIAVTYRDITLTYRQLNERANALARLLRNKGVKEDTIVGIMVEKSVEMVVGELAILKAGGAYLPLDLDYPKERIEYMLSNSSSRILLSRRHLCEGLDFNGELMDFNDEEILLKYRSNLDLDNINNYNSLAYVIYTSGTTGNPKGVMCEHRNIVRLVKDTNYINISENDRVLQTGSIAFDASTFEIWGALLNGGELYIADNETLLSPQLLKEFINKNHITILWLTSELFNQMADADINIFKGLKYLLAGGDVLSPHYISRVRKNFEGLKIINGYGPTENTTFSTTFNIEKEYSNSIPIGKPISNSKAYIVDKYYNLLPIGVCGELCVSGDGLARGYINNSKLTEEKFVSNPFEAGARMYKTGDVARWLPDGNIEFIGRIDNQIKIRGFRIELGEIENKLLQHIKVKEAVVIVRENKENGKYICAYIVSEEDIKELDLHSYLREYLPEYMIPACFIQLKKMPLTANGKLDRTVLPDPVFEFVSNEYEAPRNHLEAKLSKIWSEVLGIENIGITHNFFELGGHSLKAITLMIKIQKELNKEVSLKQIFKSPTIKELVKILEGNDGNPYLKIEKIDEKDYYEVSSAQKRMYMIHQLDRESTAYNMPVVFELQGEIDKSKIEAAFNKLVERHESLRTNFSSIDGEIVQTINKFYEFKLHIRKEEGNIEGILNKLIKPFNLEEGPLLSVEVIDNISKIFLFIDMHHIISDGISMNILINEFRTLYNGGHLEPLELQYKDFAIWQNKFLKSEDVKKQEEYWLNQFSDIVPVLNLPYDYPKNAVLDFVGDSVSFEVNEEITEALHKLIKVTGTTLHMVLLSAFTILLSKYSGQEDIVVGSPISGRLHSGIDNIVGMFVNTLALRNKPIGYKSYKEFLEEVKENSLKAYENQSYQFETLVEKLNLKRDSGRNPLFDVMLNIVDTLTGSDITLDGASLKQCSNKSRVSKFHLTLNVLESDNKILFNIEYRLKLFAKETIERMSKHFTQVLCSIVNDKEIKLNQIQILSEEEKEQLLYIFNDTKTEYPKEKTIQELFQEQVNRQPNNLAVLHKDKKLTYHELNSKANSLAEILRSKGVIDETIVGISTERSIEMIIGIMAVLKAGGAYLPIDSSSPKKRVEYMLKDSGCRIVLGRSNSLDDVDFDGELINLYNEELFHEGINNPEVKNGPHSLAYVIYTSGTTGNPKGVMVEHRALINYIKYASGRYLSDEEENMPFYTSSAFDLSITSVFAPLVSGNTLSVYEDNELKDVFTDKNLSVIKATPAHLSLVRELSNLNKSIKKLIVGGDDLTEDLAKAISNLFNNHVEIINEYGPTEATVGCIVHSYNYRYNYKNSILIGKPINNTRIYILDTERKLIPVGIAGEIYISGDGLARGYINRKELTEEKFIDNPFEPGSKMYKTGDLARWLPDGNIEFIGRSDNQIKIRGYRIELSEIENRLLQHEDIKEATVIVRERDGGDKYLTAYLVCKQGINSMDIKKYLKSTLPEYMIPSYFVELDEIPLTLNGKVDKRALPEPVTGSDIAKKESPRNEVEEKLSEIWSEVLGVEKISINDNFFDLGGHSLKAMIIISKIKEKLGRDVPVQEIFNSPTIMELGNFIMTREEKFHAEIAMAGEKEYYAASSAQKRMHMLQAFEAASVAYNMPVVFEIEGEIDEKRIQDAFRKLVYRHEALRTSFAVVEGEVVQKINDSFEFQLEVRKSDEDIKAIREHFIKPFKLDKAPLFKVELVIGKKKKYLLIDMHHIISDGISMNILIKDFAAIYNKKSLQDLRIQYKDFAEWQNYILNSEYIRKQEEYWISRFKDKVPVLYLPYDYERPRILSFEGRSTRFKFDEKTTIGLRKLAKETKTTIFMVLLSSFTILLSKYSRQEDIVIGTPIAGRTNSELQNVIGMFVNTLALRNKPEGYKKYRDFLAEVKADSFKAYENQGCQFERLVEKLNIKRDLSRNPIFDVIFSMDAVNESLDLKLDNVTLRNLYFSSSTSKFDLNLGAVEQQGEVIFYFEYNKKLFDEDTIEFMAEDFKYITQTISDNREILLKDIHLLE